MVTGTLWSGTLQRDQEVVLLPGGTGARVRGIEVHGRRLERAAAGQRVAVNLRGLRRDEVARGDVLTVAGGAAGPTYRLDVELDGGADAVLAQHRVQVHLGTSEAPARVVDLGDRAAQLRLERRLIARAGDRLVVRRIAPPDTLGGGRVLDPSPARHRERPAPQPEPEPAPAPAPEPPRPGALARRALAALRGDGLRPRAPGELAAALDVSRPALDRALGELVEARELVRCKRDVLYPSERFGQLRRVVLALVERQGSTSIAELRDALGLSRKYAQALLEQLDGERALRRRGDRHVAGPEPGP